MGEIVTIQKTTEDNYLQQNLQIYPPLWLHQPDSQPDSSVEGSYFPLNLKNETTRLRALGKNLILLFCFSIGCF